MKNIVEIKNLCKEYGDHCVLHGVNLSIPKGAVYGFLGANGAGKTTTLKILSGILFKTSGEITINGEAWEQKHLEKIGVLIERPMLYDDNTGYENLQIHGLLTNIAKPEVRIPEVLDIVGLDMAAANKLSRHYSLWMKQRLGIAIALLHGPEVVILDEPTNGLDVEGIREIRDLLDILSQKGITIIVSSHALSEIEKVCSHIGILARGKMVFEGTKASFMELGENIEENYLSLIK